MTEPKKYKVAILRGANRLTGDYGGRNWVAQNLTDWYEVNEDDYRALQFYCSRYDFTLIDPIPTTNVLGDARKVWTAELERIAKYEAEAERRKKAAAEAKKKKAAKTEMQKKEDLRKLAEQAGFALVPKP